MFRRSTSVSFLSCFGRLLVDMHGVIEAGGIQFLLTHTELALRLVVNIDGDMLRVVSLFGSRGARTVY